MMKPLQPKSPKRKISATNISLSSYPNRTLKNKPATLMPSSNTMAIKTESLNCDKSLKLNVQKQQILQPKSDVYISLHLKKFFFTTLLCGQCLQRALLYLLFNMKTHVLQAFLTTKKPTRPCNKNPFSVDVKEDLYLFAELVCLVDLKRRANGQLINVNDRIFTDCICSAKMSSSVRFFSAILMSSTSAAALSFNSAI